MSELGEMNQELLGSTAEDTFECNADVVFVIDATGSMQSSIDLVKEAAIPFADKLTEALSEKKRIINNLRIKVIWFRDFYFDGEHAYGESRFFEMPEENEEFKNFVEKIEAKGGGDEPETSLEALAMAMRSDFIQYGEKRRHIIVMFTDASAHPLEDHDSLVEEAAKLGCKPVMYPSDMIKSLTELYSLWAGVSSVQSSLGAETGTGSLDANARRLVLFAPNSYPWSDLELDFECLLKKDIVPGEGGKELDMSEVFNLLSQSM